MATKKEQQSREKLFQLMQENQELPVFAMVDGEVVADYGCHRWLGAWGESCIEEYIIGDERVYFRDDDDAEDVLNACVGGIDFYSLSEKEVEKEYNALPWEKAIFVNIDLPG